MTPARKKTLESLFENQLLSVFGCLFLTVGFLQICGLTFGHPIISFVQWPTVALGTVLICYRFFHLKEYSSSYGLALLALFAVSFLISALFNREYGLYTNIRTLVFMVFQFGILYATNKDANLQKRQKQLEILCTLFIILSAVISAVSFAFLFAGYSEVLTQEVGPTICYGFVWGRLFGAWWDPNIGAVCAVLSSLFSFYFLTRYKNIIARIFLVLNIVLQIFYVVFSDSRSGTVTLFVAVLAEAVFFFGRKFGVRTIANALKTVLPVLLFCALAVLVPKGLKAGASFVLENCTFGGENAAALKIGREGDLEGNITNRRTDIWKSAVEIYLEKPVFGVSRSAILSFAEQKLPETYIVHNDHMKFDSMHNIVFDILVSQGSVGIVLIGAFGVWWLVCIVRRRRRFERDGEYGFSALCFTTVAVTLVTSMVMTEIVYVITPIATIFWWSLGTLSRKSAEKAGEVK